MSGTLQLRPGTSQQFRTMVGWFCWPRGIHIINHAPQHIAGRICCKLTAVVLVTALKELSRTTGETQATIAKNIILVLESRWNFAQASTIAHVIHMIMTCPAQFPLLGFVCHGHTCFNDPAPGGTMLLHHHHHSAGKVYHRIFSQFLNQDPSPTSSHQ